MRSLLAIVTLGVLCAAASPAASGTLRLELQFLEPAAVRGDLAVADRAVVWIADRRVRIEQHGPDPETGDQTVIYRGDEGMLYGLTERDRTYRRIDRQTMLRAGERLAAARKDIESRLARLPEDQRAMVRMLLGSDDREAAGPAPVIESSADEESWLGRQCRLARVMRGPRVVGDACIVPWGDVGLVEADVAILRELANFQRELMQIPGLTPVELVPLQPMELLAQLGGLPLRYRKRDRGHVTSVIEVTALGSGRAADELFEVPADFALRDDLSDTAPAALPSAPAAAR